MTNNIKVIGSAQWGDENPNCGKICQIVTSKGKILPSTADKRAGLYVFEDDVIIIDDPLCPTSNKDKARLKKLFKNRKKFIKRLNMDKDYKYGGYTPIGRLDTSKPPLGRSGVKSPPITPQVNVHIYSEKIASVCVASVGGSGHCPYPPTEINLVS